MTTGYFIFAALLIFCSTKIVEAVRHRRRLERKDCNAILRRDESLMRRL